MLTKLAVLLLSIVVVLAWATAAPAAVLVALGLAAGILVSVDILRVSGRI